MNNVRLVQNWLNSIQTMKKEKVVQPCEYELPMPQGVVQRLLIVIHGLGVQVNEFTCHVEKYRDIFELGKEDYVVAPIIPQENIGDLYAVSEKFLDACKPALENCDEDTTIIVIGISNGGRIATKLMESLVIEEIGGKKILITLASPLKGTGIVKYASKIPALYNMLVKKMGVELVVGLTPKSDEVKDVVQATEMLDSHGVFLYRVGGRNDLIVNPAETTYFEGETHIIIKGADHGTIFGHPETLRFLEEIAFTHFNSPPNSSKM